MQSSLGKKVKKSVKWVYNYTIGLIVNPILNVNWSNVRISVYLRYFMMIILIINTFLTRAGMNPIPITDEEAYAVTSDILTAIMFIVNTYKNNSTSAEAIRADDVMKELKKQSEALKDPSYGIEEE